MAKIKRKAFQRLDARRAQYDDMVAKDPKKQNGTTRPGSMKK